MDKFQTSNQRHGWDTIRTRPTVIERVDTTSRGTHESVLRAYQILSEVKAMLDRGDSVETISAFIEWAEAGPSDRPSIQQTVEILLQDEHTIVPGIARVEGKRYEEVIEKAVTSILLAADQTQAACPCGDPTGGGTCCTAAAPCSYRISSAKGDEQW